MLEPVLVGRHLAACNRFAVKLVKVLNSSLSQCGESAVVTHIVVYAKVRCEAQDSLNPLQILVLLYHITALS